MAELSQPTARNALQSWLAAPGDTARLSGLVSAAGGKAIDGMGIDRFPARALASIRPGQVRFDALRPAVRLAVLVCGLGDALGVAATPEEKRDLDVMPFEVQPVDDEIVITIPFQGERRPGFGHQLYHQWTSGIQAAAIAVDCGRLDHVNSVFIAWLLQMVQAAKPVQVRVRRAKPQVQTQLRQLRLDHLLIIE